jgi:hypothetical protein
MKLNSAKVASISETVSNILLLYTEILMNKLSAFWQLFKAGQCITDAAKWKNRQITATALAAVLLAGINLLAAFGYAMPVDPETANAIAAGIIAVVNTVLTVITTDKVGFKDEVKENPVEVIPAKLTEKPTEAPTKSTTDASYFNTHYLG